MNRWTREDLKRLEISILDVLDSTPMMREEIVRGLCSPRNKSYEMIQKLAAEGKIIGVKYHSIECINGSCKVRTVKDPTYFRSGTEDKVALDIISMYPDPSVITSDAIKSVSYQIKYYPQPLRDVLVQKIRDYTGRTPLSDLSKRKEPSENGRRKSKPRGTYRK
jgi:hypothetical protein